MSNFRMIQTSAQRRTFALIDMDHVVYIIKEEGSQSAELKLDDGTLLDIRVLKSKTLKEEFGL